MTRPQTVKKVTVGADAHIGPFYKCCEFAGII